MPGPWRIDYHTPCIEYPMTILLRTGQHKYVLVSGVFMHRHLARFMVPKQRCRRSSDSIAIKPEYLDALLVRGPRDFILTISNVEKVFDFNWERF
jgi:hypothetical protein